MCHSTHNLALLPLLPLLLMYVCIDHRDYDTDFGVSSGSYSSDLLYRSRTNSFIVLVKCKSSPRVVLLKLHHSVLLFLHPVYCCTGCCGRKV